MLSDDISLSKPEQYTQAYWSGAIMALLDHWKPLHGVSLVEAMVHFHALQELIGPATWMSMKTMRAFEQYIYMYEKLTYQPMLPKSMIGGAREFIFGYYSIARRDKHRRKVNVKRARDLPVLQSYLQAHQQFD